jgi:hypothetical protein
LNRFLPWFRHNFEVIHWIVFVFIGGTILAFLLEVFATYFLQLGTILGRPPTPSDWAIYVIAPVILIFAAPIFISVALTVLQPEKQIVPPLYLQIVQFGWYLGFVYVRNNPTFTGGVILDLYYALFGGLIQEVVAIKVLGVSANPRDLLPYTFYVNSEPRKVRDILSTATFRQRLKLRESVEIEDGDEYCLFTPMRRADYPFVLELSKTQDPQRTAIHLAFFRRNRYYVAPVDDDLKEFAHSTLVLLKDILGRAPNGLTLSVGDPNEAASLVNWVVEQLDGLLPQFGRLSFMGWLKMASFITAVILTIATAVFLKSYDSAIGLAALISLYLAFELERNLRRRKR